MSKTKGSAVYLTPYRKGHGPEVIVDMTRSPYQIIARLPHADRLVFECKASDYKPRRGISVAEQAAELISFAEEYAARGDEFDRDPHEAEQRAAEWWHIHGEVVLDEAEHHAGLR